MNSLQGSQDLKFVNQKTFKLKPYSLKSLNLNLNNVFSIKALLFIQALNFNLSSRSLMNLIAINYNFFKNLKIQFNLSLFHQ